MLLAIDTSSRPGGVALADDSGQVVEARLWRSTANHTAQLMPAVTELLRAQRLRAADLSGVAVALGPGPFSALRVGVSAARGLAIAGGFPIVGIDTLSLEAGPHLSPDATVVAWLDAGRNEVAAGWFGHDGQRVREDAIEAPDALLEQGAAGREVGLIYCGEAADARRESILDHVRNRGAQNLSLLAPWTPADRLWRLALAGATRVAERNTDDLTDLQPYYLRMPTIGEPRRRDLVRQGRQSS